MLDINKEIEHMAEKMQKSVEAQAFSLDLIKSTVVKLGPEGLKKAAANLSDEQKTLLVEVLEDMKKSHKEPVKNREESLEPMSNSTPDGDYKFNEDDKPRQTEQDDKLAEEAKKRGQAEPRNQGGVPVEGWEGQIIKSEDIEKGGSGSGRQPTNPAVQGLESVKELRSRAEEAAEVQAKFNEGKEKKIEKSEDEVEAQPEPSLEDKQKVAKGNVKKMMSRMQERKLEKSVCVAALAKSFGASAEKLAQIWDVMAKSDVLSEKGNPEGSQSAVPAQMKGDEGAGPQTGEDPSVPKYTNGAAKKPEFDHSGKPKTLADKGEQPPTLQKSDGYFFEEETVYFAKSESNPFAVRTIKPNAAYAVDQMIEAQAHAQAHRLSKSTFDYNDGSEILAKSDDPTEVDVVEANAKKKSDAKRNDAAEVRGIQVDEKLSRIEGKAGPAMPFVKSQSEALIEKSLDMDQGAFDLAVANRSSEASGGFLVKSFNDDEMDALFAEPDMWKREDLGK